MSCWIDKVLKEGVIKGEGGEGELKVCEQPLFEPYSVRGKETRLGLTTVETHTMRQNSIHI